MFALPQIPMSTGAVITDAADRILVLRPTYKSGWTLPGGVMEDDGETPWEGCRREVLEETGITVTSGRLLAVDTRPAKEGRKLGVRLLFHCGVASPEQIAGIRLQRSEIREHAFVDLGEALDRLRPAIRRRVKNSIGSTHAVYLENGRPVPAVG